VCIYVFIIGECTLIFTIKGDKRKAGKEESTLAKISHKFKFQIEAGLPYELQTPTRKEGAKDQVGSMIKFNVDNRERLPELRVQVVDAWGCPVAKYKDGALKLIEQLVYKGNVAEIRARKGTKETLKIVVHDIVQDRALAKVADHNEYDIYVHICICMYGYTYKYMYMCVFNRMYT